MKITRFAQSCFLIETKGKRILIDPGNIKYDDSLLEEYRHDVDILLVTHKHSDHCNVPAILSIVDNPKTKFYTTREVAEARKELHPQIVSVWDVLKLDDIIIRVMKSFHGFLPHLKWGNEILESVWYIIDDGEKTFYHVGDSLCFSSEDVCDVLGVPVCNHGLVMWPFDAARFAQQVKATLVLPMHYDNPDYPADMEEVEKQFQNHTLNYKILACTESIEV